MPVPIEFYDFAASRGVALTRFAYMLCGDRFLAEDLTQAVLERCYKRWRQIELSRSPEAYVKKAITNEFLSLRRRPATREVLAPNPPDIRLADHAPALDERDALWRALGTLSPSHRAVLVLRYYEDLDDASIAEILGCARATVRSSASRALQALRVDPLITERTTP